MALSEQIMSKALDKFQEMTDDKNCFIFILSSLKNDKECKFLLDVIDKAKLTTIHDVIVITLRIRDARENAKGKGNYLKNVKF